MITPPKTPQALYRLFFLYIIAAFTIGWFLPIQGFVWGILLALALFLFMAIRALSRGESGLRDSSKSNEWNIYIYLFIPLMGIGFSLFSKIDVPYADLSVAQGTIAKEPYNRHKICLQENKQSSGFFVSRSACSTVSKQDHFPFQAAHGEQILLNCDSSTGRDSCKAAYAFVGQKAIVKYKGQQLYELKVGDTLLYDYETQKAKFTRERKTAWLDALWAIPLYSLPLMWVYRQFDGWKKRLAEGETLPDTVPMWWRVVVTLFWLSILAVLYWIFWVA